MKDGLEKKKKKKRDLVSSLEGKKILSQETERATSLEGERAGYYGASWRMKKGPTTREGKSTSRRVEKETTAKKKKGERIAYDRRTGNKKGGGGDPFHCPAVERVKK